MEKPKFIYKYHSAERIAQILRDLTFYMAPVSQLNDLYEFRLRSLCTTSSESKIKILAKNMVMDGIFDKTDKALEFLKKLEQSNSLPENYESNYRYTLDALYKNLDNVGRHTGVTCFSEYRNDQRMWATYGNNHTGAVIEFHTDNSASRLAKHLMPTIYLEENPQLCPSELIKEDGTFNWYVGGFLCCFKTNHWRDEGEWRLLLMTNTEQTKEERIVAFERSFVSRVFLGPRISEGDEREIREICNTYSPVIPVFKRKIDELEAREEYEGFEIIHSFEQMKYWFDK